MKNKKNKVKREKFEVTKNMSFSQIMNKHPEAAGLLIEKGMHCIGCQMAPYETLEQGSLMHGINPDRLVKEINSKLNKSAKKGKK